MKTKAPNICIVLIEPQGPLNIGSVCRSMANFGLSELRLVNPQTDHLCHEARQMAVKAIPLLEQATLFDSIQSALSDCHFSIGTTRRFGKYRSDFLTPSQAAQEVLELSNVGKTALVFGREDHGLYTSELEKCHRLLTIPTHEDLPSMNLAQAVTLCLYEINNAQFKQRADIQPAKKLAANEQVESMLQHMRTTLREVEYSDPQNPDHIVRTFRQIFGRAKLNEREVRMLHGLWSRIDWLEAQRVKNTN